ncbi:unnamed protein product, partial [Urochloa humidicola]
GAPLHAGGNALAGRCRGLSKTDRLLMCWWVFTGLTHIIIEETFVFAPGFFRKEIPNYFDEVCKFFRTPARWCSIIQKQRCD